MSCFTFLNVFFRHTQSQAREAELQEELLLAQHARDNMGRNLSHKYSDLSAQLALLTDRDSRVHRGDDGDANYTSCDLDCGSLLPVVELNVRQDPGVAGWCMAHLLFVPS